MSFNFTIFFIYVSCLSLAAMNQPDHTAACMNDNFNYTTTLKTVDGKDIGTIQFSKYSNYCSIDQLSIEPEYQKAGYGTRLFKHAISIMKLHGCTTVTLQSIPSAEGFYTKMGLKRDPRWSASYTVPMVYEYEIKNEK